MRVHLMDEAPRIGNGWRIVEVQVGHKWARLKTSAGRAKLTRRVWDEIARWAIELPPRRRKRRSK